MPQPVKVKPSEIMQNYVIKVNSKHCDIQWYLSINTADIYKKTKTLSEEGVFLLKMKRVQCRSNVFLIRLCYDWIYEDFTYDNHDSLKSHGWMDMHVFKLDVIVVHDFIKTKTKTERIYLL